MLFKNNLFANHPWMSPLAAPQPQADAQPYAGPLHGLQPRQGSQRVILHPRAKLWSNTSSCSPEDSAWTIQSSLCWVFASSEFHGRRLEQDGLWGPSNPTHSTVLEWPSLGSASAAHPQDAAQWAWMMQLSVSSCAELCGREQPQLHPFLPLCKMEYPVFMPLN